LNQKKSESFALLSTTGIFFISNYGRVLIVVFILFGDSPVSVLSIVIILPEDDYFGYLYWSSEPVLLSTSRALSSDSVHHVSTSDNYLRNLHDNL
jgi:hypothetical protein